MIHCTARSLAIARMATDSLVTPLDRKDVQNDAARHVAVP